MTTEKLKALIKEFDDDEAIVTPLEKSLDSRPHYLVRMKKPPTVKLLKEFLRIKRTDPHFNFHEPQKTNENEFVVEMSD